MDYIPLFIAALTAVTEVLLIALFGAWVSYKGVFPKENIKIVDKLVMELFTPCLIISKVIPTADPEILKEMWPLVVLCCWDIFWGLALGFIAAKILKSKHSGVMQAAIAFPNAISSCYTLAIALSKTEPVQLLASSSGLYKGSSSEVESALIGRATALVLTSTVWWNFARWTVAYSLLSKSIEQSWTEKLKKVFTPPPVIACFIAFIFGAITPVREWWKAGNVLADAVEIGGRSMVPCVLIVLGARVYWVISDYKNKKSDQIELKEINEDAVDTVEETPEIVIPDNLCFKEQMVILLIKQGVCIPLALVFTFIMSKVTSDPMLLIVAFLQAVGPPMINLSIMAGLQGNYERSLSELLMYTYSFSIISWMVAIFFCLQLLTSVLPYDADFGNQSSTLTVTVLE